MPPKERKLPVMETKVVIPAEHRIPRKASGWIEHVRAYAKAHNTTFFLALKIPEVRETYHSSKK